MLACKSRIRSQALFTPRVGPGIAVFNPLKSVRQPFRSHRLAISLSTMAASRDPIVRALQGYTTSVAHYHPHITLARLSSEELMPPAAAMCRMRSAS